MSNPREEYSEFLEKLRIEIGDFFRIADLGKNIKYNSLKSRKKSIFLRELLKEFRNVSLQNEKYLKELKDEEESVQHNEE